ncbi:hypothetical protein ACLKA7_000210 [Drosophila subpalustris]
MAEPKLPQSGCQQKVLERRYQLACLRRTKWRVSDEFTFSDHRAIHFEIGGERQNQRRPNKSGPKWKDRFLDADTFSHVFNVAEWNPTGTSVDDMARQLSECLDAACDSSMPRRKPSRRGSPCFWWNDQIAQLRKACLRARRCSQRARRRPDFEDRLEDLRAAKRALKRAIKASKSSCFKQICEEADVNPWGTAYKVVTKTIRGQDSLRVTCPILLRSIVETLFPQHAEQGVSFASRLESWQPISVDEVKSATKRIGDRKAPGPDGIPNKALKLAISTQPEVFVNIFNKILERILYNRLAQQYKENVRGVRHTAAVEVLLQMSKTADNTTSKLHYAVQKALGETANVIVISDKMRLEIRDLPEWATAEDVTITVLKHIEGDLTVESAPKLRKGYRGTQIASMFLTKAMADTLLAMRDIRIGWALCSIRSKVDPRRCYKCLEFGHTAARCRSKHDASKKCFNCGGEGHSSKDCTKASSCILCARAGAQNTGHHTLSKGCPLAAQDLLKQTVRENAIDIAILCEPYSAKQDGSWLQNHRRDCS